MKIYSSENLTKHQIIYQKAITKVYGKINFLSKLKTKLLKILILKY